MSHIKALRARQEGNSQIDDIWEVLLKRDPLYIQTLTARGERPAFTAEQFAKLPRDPEGNVIGLHSPRRTYNLFSKEQLASITQHDKDQIRYDLHTEMTTRETRQ